MKQRPDTADRDRAADRAADFVADCDALAEALVAMRDVAECRALLMDLATPAELEALADRWRVVRLLKAGLPYREIHDRTGVSVTTIGRVARFLEMGHGGYRLALERTSTAAGAAANEERG